jgi:heme A synthase
MSKGEIEAVAGGYSVMQVHLHFTHRVLAAVVGIWALTVVVAAGYKAPGRRELLAPRVWLVALLFAQIALGAMVIWRDGYPDVATAHQATGAALLAVATWVALRIHLVSAPSGHRQPADNPQPAPTAANPQHG